MEVLEAQCQNLQDVTPLLTQLCNQHLDDETQKGLKDKLENFEQLVTAATDEIDKILSIIYQTRLKEKGAVEEVIRQIQRQLHTLSFWKKRRFLLSKADIAVILTRKPRLNVSGLQDLPCGPSSQLLLMENALKAERLRIQKLINVGDKKAKTKEKDDNEDDRGSEASSTTLSTQCAKIVALKRAVVDAESFLGSEEGQGKDPFHLKKLEIFERTLGLQLRTTERLQTNRGLGPLEQEEIDDWLAQGQVAISEICTCESCCTPASDSPPGYSKPKSAKLKFKHIIPQKFGRNPGEYLTWKRETKRLTNVFELTGEMALLFLLENCLEQTVRKDLKKVYTDKMHEVEDMFNLLDREYINPSRDFNTFINQVERLPEC